MTVYFAGCEPNVMTFTSTPDTTAGKFDSNYARCCLLLSGELGGTLEVPAIVGDNSATGWWLHFKWHSPTENPSLMDTGERTAWSQDWCTVRDAAAGNIAMKLKAVTSVAPYGRTQAHLYSYDSATSTASTLTWQYTANTVHDFDIHCYVSGVDSKLDVYIDGNLEMSVTRASDDNNGLKTVEFNNAFTSGYTASQYLQYVSEIIVADTDTRGWRVKTLPPTGDSATNTAWTGSYTDVDEIVPDGNAAYSATVGQLETYTMSTIGANQGLVAVAVGTLITGNGTNDVQAVIRKGGTDYVSADLGLTTGKLPYCSVWNTDPTDSQPWDAGETLSGVEFGVKSVA